MKSDAVRNMPNMTPAQREQMKKQGIEMPTKHDGAITQKICITKEMIDKDRLPMAREQSECKVKNQVRSGNSYRIDMECNGSNLKGTAVVKGAFPSSDRYVSTYDFTGTSRGREVKQHHESSGKWLQADCGKVKPMGEMMGGSGRR